MVSHTQDHESLLHNSIFDTLYCDEERFDENAGSSGSGLKEPEIEIQNNPFEQELLWEDEEIVTLLGKEKEQYSDLIIIYDGDLKAVRNAAIGWMMKVIGYYGFTAMTAVLAVNYLDRFITSVWFQKDKPWMGQLAAVACLSIAAKVEETKVPLLLNLQVEESKYLFEAKTIQRMELLVLSTLQWKMNPVTPISFIDHTIRRFRFGGSMSCSLLHWEFLRRCESVVLSVITDCRLRHYLPSVVAAATMIHVIREMDSCDAMGYRNQLTTVLRTRMEEFENCQLLIAEAMGDINHTQPCQKRKHEYCIPSSPSGIIDAYFSSDSSVNSWAAAAVAAAPSTSSSPEPLLKRNRTMVSSLADYPH